MHRNKKVHAFDVALFVILNDRSFYVKENERSEPISYVSEQVMNQFNRAKITDIDKFSTSQSNCAYFRIFTSSILYIYFFRFAKNSGTIKIAF